MLEGDLEGGAPGFVFSQGLSSAPRLSLGGLTQESPETRGGGR